MAEGILWSVCWWRTWVLEGWAWRWWSWLLEAGWWLLCWWWWNRWWPIGTPAPLPKITIIYLLLSSREVKLTCRHNQLLEWLWTMVLSTSTATALKLFIVISMSANCRSTCHDGWMLLNFTLTTRRKLGTGRFTRSFTTSMSRPTKTQLFLEDKNTDF